MGGLLFPAAAQTILDHVPKNERKLDRSSVE
jgi:hypothetical protein